MRTATPSEGWNDLVDGLKQLEALFPMLASNNGPAGGHDERSEIEEEVQELEDLIAAAGEPEDEHSLRALTFLQTELARKRALLDLLY